MGNLLPGGSRLLSSSSRRRSALLGALAAAGTLVAAPAAQALPTSFTWNGGGTNTNWSTAGNWDENAVPQPGVGTPIDFFTHVCATAGGCTSTADAGYTAQPLTLADDQNLTISPDSGGALTLTPDSSGVGLVASPNGTGGSVNIQTPITLSADQTWDVTGAGAATVSSTPHPSGLALTGPVSGAGVALTVNVSDGGNLSLSAGASVGSLTVDGTDTSSPGSGAFANGQVSFGGNINVGAGPVTVRDVSANFSSTTTGPLALDGTLSQFFAGQGLVTHGALTLDPTNSTSILLSTDASQVAATATGNITVGGQLFVDPPRAAYPSTACLTQVTGTTYTLLSTTGGQLSGTFNDYTGQPIPDGGVVTTTSSCTLAGSTALTTQSSAYRIHYTSTAVTATVIPSSATTLASSTKLLATNQPETLTATVTQTSGTPAGTVAFSSFSPAGQVVLPGCGAVPVAGGTATCTTTALAADPGTYYLQAAYTPADPNVAGSTSQQATLVKVTAGSTTTALSVDHATTTTAGTVTYTAQVTPADAGPNAPTGKVAFTEGGSPAACTQSTRGLTSLSSTGVATCTVAYTATGPHAVTATYQGDEDFDGSASAPTTVAVTTSAAPVTVTPTTAPKAGTGVSTVASPVSKPGSKAVTVPLKCAAGGASCTVTVRLTTTQTVTGRHGKKISRTVVLGTKTTTLAAGQSRKVAVTLNGKGKVLLARNNRLKTKVSVVSMTAAGTKKTVTKQVTLTAVKPAKRHRGRRG